MPPSVVHLPNGLTLTVTPVFGGLYFKSNELSHHSSPFPPGWTIVLNSEDPEPSVDSASPPAERTPSPKTEEDAHRNNASILPLPRRHMIHRFRKPTLRDDHLYISSISNPSSNEFKPPTSPTRQIAMMLWATLWWYFHQPEPEPYLITPESAKTPEEGKPKGDWRVNINREGIFKAKVLHKLERMGLIASEDSAVGTDLDERSGEGWKEMFVSRKSFWQLDARLYLFTLTPAGTTSPFLGGTPLSSRPASPARQADNHVRTEGSLTEHPTSPSLWSPSPNSGPFRSASHLPTFYPPPPTQFTFTNGIRHPIRPKPPRQAEPFYTRYVPSLGQYLSFRVATLSSNPCTHSGPVGEKPHGQNVTCEKSDAEFLHNWMNLPRVAKYWGETGDLAHMTAFLTRALSSKHSIPIIGCFDGRPFGFFELYWVKEDILGKYLGGECGNYDRGLHCLVGEQEFRGPHRVKVWLSALVHYCWLADSRTETVMMEPRIDNDKLAKYCTDVGFFKEREISFPHKQSNLFKILREAWDAPAI